MNSMCRKTLLIFMSICLLLPHVLINIVKANPISDLPITMITVEGNQGNNGIYYGNVTFRLSSFDSDGISNIQYKLSSKENWKNYSSPVTLSVVKGYAIHYRAIDKLGNVEVENVFNLSIKKDTIPPSSTAMLDASLPINGIYNTPVTLSVSATDMQSGVKKIEYSLNNGVTWIQYNAPITINSEGTSIIYYRAIDNFDNYEKRQSIKISQDFTPPTSPTIEFEQKSWTYQPVKVECQHKIRPFFKGSFLKFNWTQITECSMNTMVVEPINIII